MTMTFQVVRANWTSIQTEVTLPDNTVIPNAIVPVFEVELIPTDNLGGTQVIRFTGSDAQNAVPTYVVGNIFTVSYTAVTPSS